MIARTIINRTISPVMRTQSRGMAGHNRQGLRAANEIAQESVKAFALAMFVGLVFKVGYMDPAEAEVKQFYEKQASK